MRHVIEHHCLRYWLFSRAAASSPILAPGDGFATPAAGFLRAVKKSRALGQLPILAASGHFSGPRFLSYIRYLPVVLIALATR